MTTQFVSEWIKPVTATLNTSRMAAGEPGLPSEFVWRGETVTVVRIRKAWREAGPCRHGSGEQYVRKHWYEVEDAGGRVLKMYFDRNPRGKQARRWCLFSLDEEMAGSEET